VPIYWIGGTISLAANGTGEISLSPDEDVDILAIHINNTGRAEITSAEMARLPPFIVGVMEIDLLKKHGNVYELPEPISWSKGVDFVWSFKDISGASNVVYLAFLVRS